MQPDPAAPDAVTAAPDEVELRLTVAAVARRLGIAPATLRTWDRRYGLGPGSHEPGSHRRYGRADLARLELMQAALTRGVSAADAAQIARTGAVPVVPPGGAVPPEAVAAVETPFLLSATALVDGAAHARPAGRVLRLPGAVREAHGLARAALALDAAAIRDLLARSLGERGVEFTWDRVVRPVLAAVAERWADSGTGIEIEHLVSECIVTVFSVHAAAAPIRAPRPVLLAGMPGERHVLPLAALAAELADRGVSCRSLGADLPLEALIAALRRSAPAAVVLWSQLPPTADPAVPGGLPRTRPRARIFVAGPGWEGVPLPPRVPLLRSLAGAAREIAAAADG